MRAPVGGPYRGAHDQRIRRNRDRGALRRIADGDVAGPRRLPRAAGGQGHVPQRHDVHAPPPPSGRGGARALGHPRAAGGHRLPAGDHLRVRLRSDERVRVAPAGRRRGARLRAPAHRARRAAGGRRRGGRRRAARGLHRRRDPVRRRARERHRRPRQGRRARDRAGTRGDRGGRDALARGQGRAAEAIQRGASPHPPVLRVLERPSRGRVQDLSSAPSTAAAGRSARRTTA